MYSEPATGGLLNWLAVTTASEAARVTELITTRQSFDSTTEPMGEGFSRVPVLAAACAAAGAPLPASAVGAETLVSPPKASLADEATTEKKTAKPTIVPTIDKIRAVIPIPLALSFKNSETIARMKA